MSVGDCQLQPLDLSCPAKKLSSRLSPGSSSSSLGDSRRLSHGSDDVFVASGDRSPSRTPIDCRRSDNGSESDSDHPKDYSTPQIRSSSPRLSLGPARKRFLSKYLHRDVKGKLSVSILRTLSGGRLDVFYFER